jgi:hypothetical protein
LPIALYALIASMTRLGSYNGMRWWKKKSM